MVARSPADATRFTATGPQIYSKNTTFRDPPPSSKYGPAPPNETPQQKVIRLREAARLQKEKVPPLEKMIVAGRRVLDKVHRTSVLTIVGLSGKSLRLRGDEAAAVELIRALCS